MRLLDRFLIVALVTVEMLFFGAAIIGMFSKTGREGIGENLLLIGMLLPFPAVILAVKHYTGALFIIFDAILLATGYALTANNFSISDLSYFLFVFVFPQLGIGSFFYFRQKRKENRQ